MIRLPGKEFEDWAFDDDGIPYQIPYIPPIEMPVPEYEPEDRQILRIKAESGRLPDFLTLDEIAFLLGYKRRAFNKFIQNEPLEIEYLETPIEEDDGRIFIHKTSGTTREKFKAYRQSINQWPVTGLLANWWTDDKHNDEGRRDQQIRIICETARAIGYEDLLNIPEGGRAAIKTNCSSSDPHLFSKDAFKRAWTEANKRGLIRIENKEKFVSKQ
ncbi:hypothetical protein IVG45_11125 [Methylomonas sp. LL1]|uniref:hypothetical protein n=1 Tax=Methylomonas sp. LL1 TaxID=2785785 RepID=UPI0018C422A0|nr:hypothetical protein [Methylomonas sp. LL1]QPK65434.1 hypothetical protein IVG45_11125 [Methylomonas sp. LL1]